VSRWTGWQVQHYVHWTCTVSRDTEDAALRVGRPLSLEMAGPPREKKKDRKQQEPQQQRKRLLSTG